MNSGLPNLHFLLKLHVHVFFLCFFYLHVFVFFIFSSPSFVTVYKNPLKYFFFSLFFFFFKKKKIKKGRAGNLSPKMFKIRMRWGNKGVRKNSALLFYYLLTTYLLMILDILRKKKLHTNCFLFFVKEQGPIQSHSFNPAKTMTKAFSNRKKNNKINQIARWCKDFALKAYESPPYHSARAFSENVTWNNYLN